MQPPTERKLLTGFTGTSRAISEVHRRFTMRGWLPVFCIICLIMGCRPGSNPDTIRKDIGDQGKLLVDGFNRQNIAEVMSVYWNGPELVAIYPDTTYHGADDVKQLCWDLFAKVEVRNFGTTDSHIEPAESGDLAYEWGKFDFSYRTRTGTTLDQPGTYLRIWKKQNKKWVIIVTQSSAPLMPALPASSTIKTEKNNT